MIREDAVLLVAGKGIRLAPLTNNHPKPLTLVNGTSILENALANLATIGVKRVHLVTGYQNQMLMRHAMQASLRPELSEIFSPEFSSTNNMYSLWLARDVLRRGCYLLEGDVFFELEIARQLQGLPLMENYWVADLFTSGMNGCQLRSSNEGMIRELEIIRQPQEVTCSHAYKSIGLLSISPALGSLLSGWLAADIEKGRTDVYYDLVLADHLQAARFNILNIAGLKWVEIDDLDDLRRAEQLFAAKETRA